MKAPFPYEYPDLSNDVSNSAPLYSYGYPGYRELSRLRRNLSCLWTYIIEQELWEEALEFIDDHMEGPLPFDLYPYEA